LRERFADPAFDAAGDALPRVVDIAWTAYRTYRKTPRTRKAGPGFADPDFDLPVEWLDTRERIQLARREHQDPAGRSRVLLVCGAARTDQTCPGEMSNVHCDLLDLSHLTAEYGRQIATSAFRKKCATPRAPLWRRSSWRERGSFRGPTGRCSTRGRNSHELPVG
jgi:hypothetical protein